jgi:rod shape-determining protein MreC
MHWILRFIVQHRNTSSLALMVLLSLWMLSGTPAQQHQVSRFLLMSAFYPLQFITGQVTRVKNIFAENRRLHTEVMTLSMAVAQLQEQAAENERLRKLLDLRQEFSYTLVAARVMAREPSHAYRGVVLNIGSDKGILRYMPVINSQGVAGKVVQVMGGICLVQILKDPSCRISVMVKRSREVGILETDNGEDFFVSFRSHMNVHVDDSVVTSGMGGTYPRGLLAGTVAAIQNDHDPLFKRAYIQTAVNFDHLEEVFIMRLSPQWQAFREELDSMETRQ